MMITDLKGSNNNLKEDGRFRVILDEIDHDSRKPPMFQDKLFAAHILDPRLCAET